MPTIKADCPRCNTKRHTFDVLAYVYRGTQYGWQRHYEIFSNCRGCFKPTTFVIEQTLASRDKELTRETSHRISEDVTQIMKTEISLENIFEVTRYVSLRDNAIIQPPQHLDKFLEAIFAEGSACYAIGCYNAAATMFRLCLDIVSSTYLPSPDENTEQPNAHQRRNLAPRLDWLFNNLKLPAELKELAKAVREDGNDGAHAGNLCKHDVDDIIDFTTAFLERLITEPAKIRLAQERRAARRASPSS